MECISKAYQHHLPNNLSPHRFRACSHHPVAFFSFISPSSPSIKNVDPRSKFGPFFVPTVAVAATALFFERLHRNPPVIPASVGQLLESVEGGSVKELELKRKACYVQALYLCKLKQGAIVRLLHVGESSDYESLRARIRSTTEWLESARRELDDVVDKDPGRVMEYSQVVDELMDILRDMEVYIDKCEKENARGYLGSCNRLLSRVRKLESQILDALREFQEEED